jgi:Helix-turn-helix domain
MRYSGPAGLCRGEPVPFPERRRVEPLVRLVSSASLLASVLPRWVALALCCGSSALGRPVGVQDSGRKRQPIFPLKYDYPYKGRRVKSYRIKEAADYLGLHEVTLAERARAGKVSGAAKVGKCWTFDEVGLVAYRNSLSPCPYTGEVTSGGSNSPRTAAELESLLGLPTRRPRRSTRKDERASYGGKQG